MRRGRGGVRVVRGRLLRDGQRAVSATPTTTTASATTITTATRSARTTRRPPPKACAAYAAANGGGTGNCENDLTCNADTSIVAECYAVGNGKCWIYQGDELGWCTNGLNCTNEISSNWQ